MLSGLIGFFFSEDEPTALIQNCGGPCSVIASVQVVIFAVDTCKNSTNCIFFSFFIFTFVMFTNSGSTILS